MSMGIKTGDKAVGTLGRKGIVKLLNEERTFGHKGVIGKVRTGGLPRIKII